MEDPLAEISVSSTEGRSIAAEEGEVGARTVEVVGKTQATDATEETVLIMDDELVD